MSEGYEFLIGKGEKSTELLSRMSNRHGLIAGATGERVIIVTGCSFYCSIKGFRNFKQLYFVHCLE